MDWRQLWEVTSTPDNVPIVLMMLLIPYFLWYGFREAVRNDRLISQLEADPALAKTHHRKSFPFHPAWDKVLHTWPYLLRVEFLAALIVTAFLMLWAVYFDAPLEEPANPMLTMNPAKAPWYFLGLQELLVYFDPWIAGVLLPGFIIVGLMAVPYLDRNPKGNGYFTFNERKAEITIFLFGFVVLWCSLIVLGTFLRGPNWNFFGPFEYWDTHKLEALTNVNLSQYIWMRGLRIGMPTFWLTREIFGILLVLAYVFVLPVVLARTAFKKYYEKLGPGRYYVGAFLFLMMMSLPAKMLMRWVFNLKYIVAIPEIFFNI